MNFTTILLTAVGLAMDAFAVSITNGMLLKEVKIKDALKVGAYFGIAQAVMPLIGWLLCVKFQDYVTAYDHWVALLLLGFIGGKMIYEGIKSRKEGCVTEEAKTSRIDNKTLFLLAIATSIDALAVGVSFAFLNVGIFESVIVIGIITLILCFIGVLLGKKCLPMLKSNAELAGGIILLFIGLKIFAEHTELISNLFSLFS
ncbi:MAG TPA: manganese efflux pump [Clostridiaceae bacterium]|nr:manganese efflux pump [Clostridiaceae bacterium]